MIRREPFGGLIFNEENFRIYVFDKPSFRTIELSLNNIKIDNIQDRLKKEFNIYINTSDIHKFLREVYAKNQKFVFNRRVNLNNSNIWNIKWKGTHLYSPIFIYWSFTNKCNLRCIHCAWNSGVPSPNELSIKEGLELIDELDKIGVGYISFSGGEPLVQQDKLFAFAEYAKHKMIPIGLATNATLINNKVAEKIKRIGFSEVQVSLEGVISHEIIRGKGLFNKTISAIKILVKHGIPVTLSPTVSHLNANELEKLIKIAVSLGVKRIKFVRFIPIGRGMNNLELFKMPPIEEFLLSLKLWYLRWKYADKIDIQLNKHYVVIGLSLARYFAPKEYKKYIPSWDWDCPAGRIRLNITPEGRLAPCPLMGSLGLSTGDIKRNIDKDYILDIWNNSKLFNLIRREKREVNPTCNSCPYWHLCKGGCKAASYAVYGDLFKEDPLCIKKIDTMLNISSNKKIIKLLCKLYNC